MTSVRIACAQIAPAVGDADGNRRLAREAVQEAIGARARIVLLPELVMSGYVFESAEEAFDKLFTRVRNIEQTVEEINGRI